MVYHLLSCVVLCMSSVFNYSFTLISTKCNSKGTRESYLFLEQCMQVTWHNFQVAESILKVFSVPFRAWEETWIPDVNEATLRVLVILC